tara:strand:- start:98 stop:313 length:216 start_codon:yes stop_codon:yes gene_type:complete
MKKPRYEYRIAIIMLILTVIPIGATQLGWYLYDKQVGLDYGMIAGTFSVILAAYLMYQKGWRNEDDEEDDD